MDFDVVNLLISLIFGTFGLIYYRYGRRLNRVPWITVGIVLMVYGYFIPSRIWMTVLGLLLMAIPFTLWK